MRRWFDGVLLGSVELFCLAAEAGSFTQAAQQAGVTPAAVSRSVARLEARLGIRLFVRSTRQIRLTEAGQVYLRYCRQALAQLAEAEREASGRQQAPAGVLRLSVPTTYGHYRILPLLPAFRAQYPDVQVDVHIGNRNVHFADDGYDLAIRARVPADSGLVARTLEQAELIVVGSPAYLRERGTPKVLDDLEAHECIQFVLPSTGRPVPWLFRVQGVDEERLTQGGYRCEEEVLGGVTLARAGAGLYQTYRFIVEEDLRKGHLVSVLAPFGGRARPFSLLYPHGRFMPLRVRCFVDFLLAQGLGAGSASV